MSTIKVCCTDTIQYTLVCTSDKAERYGMASQLINIYLTTPTIEED